MLKRSGRTNPPPVLMSLIFTLNAWWFRETLALCILSKTCPRLLLGFLAAARVLSLSCLNLFSSCPVHFFLETDFFGLIISSISLFSNPLPKILVFLLRELVPVFLYYLVVRAILPHFPDGSLQPSTRFPGCYALVPLTERNCLSYPFEEC